MQKFSIFFNTKLRLFTLPLVADIPGDCDLFPHSATLSLQLLWKFFPTRTCPPPPAPRGPYRTWHARTGVRGTGVRGSGVRLVWGRERPGDEVGGRLIAKVHVVQLTPGIDGNYTDLLNTTGTKSKIFIVGNVNKSVTKIHNKLWIKSICEICTTSHKIFHIYSFGFRHFSSLHTSWTVICWIAYTSLFV